MGRNIKFKGYKYCLETTQLENINKLWRKEQS